MSTADARPLVSCIMPTFNRRAFLSRAVKYFRRQDYSNRELIIVDDGTDAVGDLIPADERIHYIRRNARMTVGAKRNLACEEARGEIITHWDDDDWHAARRLSYQVQGLRAAGKQVCGTDRALFFDVARVCAWRYVHGRIARPWLSGSTLCYTRAFWQRNRFANVNVGEDALFVSSVPLGGSVVLGDETFHVGTIHRTNVSAKRVGTYWYSYPLERLRQLVGEDWSDLQSGGSGAANPTVPANTGRSSKDGTR